MAAINTLELSHKHGISHARVKKFIRDAGIRYVTDGNGGYVINEADFVEGFARGSSAGKVYKHKKRKSADKPAAKTGTKKKGAIKAA